MIDKPTYETYYTNGTIKYQYWYKNGKFHRSNGLPAWVCYHENGNIKYQEYWENGNYISNKKILQRQYQWLNKIINNFNKKGIRL